MVRRVLREEIRERLIDDILSGRLTPGTRIVETRLAQELDVSQAPVREALRDLELFGFVTSSPFRGTQVREISPEDLLEIYPIRAALEAVGARAAATRIDEETLSRLEALIVTMREAAAKATTGRTSTPITPFIKPSSRPPATACCSTSGRRCGSRQRPSSPTR